MGCRMPEGWPDCVVMIVVLAVSCRTSIVVGMWGVGASLVERLLGHDLSGVVVVVVVGVGAVWRCCVVDCFDAKV